MTPPEAKILTGDAREILPTLPADYFQTCITSPPYWGLRDYGHPAQMGLEKSPEDYVANLVGLFREVRRVLKPDGTLWLNLADTYARNPSKGGSGEGGKNDLYHGENYREAAKARRGGLFASGLKEKDLCGIPWRVAFALQADGWYLRADIIWAKPNPMPESVTDRPTKSHEYIFLLTRSATYFYDYEAVREAPSPALIKQIEQGYNGQATKDFVAAGAQNASGTKARIIEGYRKRIDKQRGHSRRHAGFNDRWAALSPTEQAACGRNKRDVWTVPSANYGDDHFATFPPDLVKPCILAGSRLGDTVLDPFGGSGTTGAVSIELGRSVCLIELNPEFAKLCAGRTNTTPAMI